MRQPSPPPRPPLPSWPALATLHTVADLLQESPICAPEREAANDRHVLR